MAESILAILKNSVALCSELPDVATSTVNGRGLKFYSMGMEAANVVRVIPRMTDGHIAACVKPDDVQLLLSCACTRVPTSLHEIEFKTCVIELSSTGEFQLSYAVDAACACCIMFANIRVCGVLLTGVHIYAAFNVRSYGRLYDRHHLKYQSLSCRMAIDSTGSHMAVSYWQQDVLEVYTLPEMTFLIELGGNGDGPMELNGPRGGCFTDAGDLLVVDNGNFRIQHWSLNGASIATYPLNANLNGSCCIASYGDMFAVGTHSGMRVHMLESGAELHSWPYCEITAVAFVNATMLACAIRTTIQLCALNGSLLRHVSSSIQSCGLAVSADGCLLVSDVVESRVRVFAPDGKELVSQLATQVFQSYPTSIAFGGARVYVLESHSGASRLRLNVFTN